MKHGVTSRMLSFCPLLLAGSAMLNGCFFDRLQQSEESDIQRVQQKQSLLQSEQSGSATLKQQEDMLATELSERELSLNELNDRVQAINAQNGRGLAGNEAARIQYGVLLNRLHDTNRELAAAQQGTTDSIADRRARIASLKARLTAEVDSLFP